MTIYIAKLCAKLSSNVDVIAYNGQKAQVIHENIGYCGHKSVVLDNGVDCNKYKYDALAREKICKELCIDSGKKIILTLTKNTPIKDIPTFIRAFALLKGRIPDSVAILCGTGIIPENFGILKLCRTGSLQLNEEVFLLGVRDDVVELLSACDVYMLHSAAEAFPNSLIQAMSCGCLCVSTNVGDAARILNMPDLVVKPHDAVALADKTCQVLRLPNKTQEMLKKSNRKRVETNFNIIQIIRNYEALFL